MGAKTNISWTDASWNPIRGCSLASRGCQNCYAMNVAQRYSGPGQPYEGLARTVNGHAAWTNKVAFFPHKLVEPLQWQEPKKIFVNSMSDFWHPDVTLDWQAQMWAVMITASHHTFQILTKRPERISAMLCAKEFAPLVNGYLERWRTQRPRDQRVQAAQFHNPIGEPAYNIWIGASVEDQGTANTRIPHLMQVPAAIRFLSCEPLLGPINLEKLTAGFQEPGRERAIEREVYPFSGLFAIPDCDWEVGKIHWVIDGGESGQGFRQADHDWYRSIRDQCARHGVAYFHKQDSGLKPGQGVLLDGRVYHEFPEVSHA